MGSVHQLYPDQRWVAAEMVISWAHDLWSDEAPKRRCRQCGTVTVAINYEMPQVQDGEFRADDLNNPCTCDAATDPVYPEGEMHPDSLEDCIAYLEDVGVATFVKQGN